MAPVSAVVRDGVRAEAAIDMRGVCLAEGAEFCLHDKDGATRRRGGSDLDDSEGSPFWPEEEVAAQSSLAGDAVVEVASAFDCPPVDLCPDEELVAPTEANWLRQSYRLEREGRIASNSAIARKANGQSVSAAVALSVSLPQEALAFSIDHAEAPRDAPEWAYKGHPSHIFLGFGGFVTCGRCDSVASRDITKNILIAPCPRTCSTERGKALRRLSDNKLPYRHPEWPDGGADVEAGVSLHRLRFRGLDVAE